MNMTNSNQEQKNNFSPEQEPVEKPFVLHLSTSHTGFFLKDLGYLPSTKLPTAEELKNRPELAEKFSFRSDPQNPEIITGIDLTEDEINEVFFPTLVQPDQVDLRNLYLYYIINQLGQASAYSKLSLIPIIESRPQTAQNLALLTELKTALSSAYPKEVADLAYLVKLEGKLKDLPISEERMDSLRALIATQTANLPAVKEYIAKLQAKNG